MSDNDQKSGFEYKNKGTETPFETFLRYTNEKEKSSELLASILSLVPKTSILDIGSGNGQYLEQTLSNIKDSADSSLTLLEPSSDLIKQLQARFGGSLVTIIHSSIDSFSTDEKFDVVLASHLFYHIPRPEWPAQLLKMLSFLKPEGKLIVVLREKDDAYAFKMAFKPLLFNEDFQALTLQDVLAGLPESGLTISRHTAESELIIPVNKSAKDTISIIEFYLNKQWQEIPVAIRQDALTFIQNRNKVFAQRDGIAVIQKTK
jgi:cyclopropane fatty-acyl-phospholipid synthase-like methyltransferase